MAPICHPTIKSANKDFPKKVQHAVFKKCVVA